jgi:hypothetical protein
MKRKWAALILASTTLLAVGCTKPKTAAYMSTDSDRGSILPRSVSVSAASTQRYIAERRKLEVISGEADLQKSREAAISFCGTLQC